jgi:hypothetical protein
MCVCDVCTAKATCQLLYRYTDQYRLQYQLTDVLYVQPRPHVNCYTGTQISIGYSISYQMYVQPRPHVNCYPGTQVDSYS